MLPPTNMKKHKAALKYAVKRAMSLEIDNIAYF